MIAFDVFLSMFILSGIVIASVLVNKVIEIRKDRPTFISTFLAKFDAKTEAFVVSVKADLRNRFTDTKTFIVEDVPKGSLERAKSLHEKLQEKYRDMMPDVRGKRVLKTERNASDFLDQIKRDREQGGKGRIEDTIIE